MTDICCIGHITLDEIITASTKSYLPGGTAWYFSNAISQLPVQFQLITAVAESEKYFVSELKNVGIQVQCFPTEHTIQFVNSYAEDQDHRTQQVIQQADPFSPDQLTCVDAVITHLGPLVANDIAPELIPVLAEKTRVSLDVQGYLRSVQEQQVVPVQWKNAAEILPYVYYLKANEHELEVLTGYSDVYDGAKALAAVGVKEVIITMGSHGSIILNEEHFYTIPAYEPQTIIDATGCGDTYMAGYLFKRVKGDDIFEAGRFAAAMATLNISKSGAFAGSEEEILSATKY